MKKNILGSTIKELRLSKRMTQKQLSELTGYSQNTISNHENMNRSLDEMDIKKYAEALGVTPQYLFDRAGNESPIPTNIIPATLDNMIRIPIIGTIACGDPILADENIIGYRYHLKETMPSGETFYLKAKGDSMVPKIPDGADVLIRHQDTVEDGEIAAVLVNGDTEVTLKRVKKQGDIVMLVAENSAYAPYIITENNPARILGKAVEVVFDL